MKILKNICNTIVTILLVIFIVIICIFLASKYIFKDKVPNVFGYSICKVVSGSMEPDINIGDFVIVKKTDQYKVKDIVTYIDEGGSLVTHRIIEINNNTIITKGDANNVEDPYITKDDVYGKVVYVLEKETLNLCLIIVGVVVILGLCINVVISILKSGE